MVKLPVEFSKRAMLTMDNRKARRGNRNIHHEFKRSTAGTDFNSGRMIKFTVFHEKNG